jgi:putative acetyltransferase
MAMHMHIQQESPNQADIVALLGQLDAYCAALYPAESNHLMDIASLSGADVVFLAARDAAAGLLGCGAFVGRGDYAEVKRMMVAPASRGQGVGGALLAEIARRARVAGFTSLKLETGISQPEAIALYERDGFVYRAPFGDYRPDPLSLFMEKPL